MSDSCQIPAGCVLFPIRIIDISTFPGFLFFAKDLLRTVLFSVFIYGNEIPMRCPPTIKQELKAKLGRIPSSLSRSLLARVWQWLYPHRPLVAGPAAGLRAWHLLCLLTNSSFSQNRGFYAQGDLSKDIFSLVCKRNIFVSLVFSDSFMSLNKHSMT